MECQTQIHGELTLGAFPRNSPTDKIFTAVLYVSVILLALFTSY